MVGPISSCEDQEDDGNGRHLLQAATAQELVTILSRRIRLLERHVQQASSRMLARFQASVQSPLGRHILTGIAQDHEISESHRLLLGQLRL
jgi:hypothetical protein